MTVSMRKAEGQDSRDVGRPFGSADRADIHHTDTAAYRQFVRHLSMPCMELRGASDGEFRDVGAMEVVWCNQAMAVYAGALSPEDLAGRTVSQVAPLLLPDLRMAHEQGLWRTDDSGRVGLLGDGSEQGVVMFGVGDPSVVDGCRVGVTSVRSRCAAPCMARC
ncbi:MAG: hypothetical protein ACP5G7_07015 [Anaerolineae bacterium]